MVFIENKSQYLQPLFQTPLAPILKELLEEKTSATVILSNNASEVALNLLICLKSDNFNLATEIYTQFSKRVPAKENHWIYDDYVIFSIVCAVRKFRLPPEWIRNVIDLAYSNATNTDKKIKDTFRNILVGNFNVNGDFHQLSLVYQCLAKDENFESKSIDDMFLVLWNMPFPFFEKDFLNVVSVKAIEIAFLKKGLLTLEKIHQIEEFIPSFNKRADIISKIIAWIIISVLILLTVFFLWELNFSETEYSKLNKMIFFLLSISGFGVSIIFELRNGVSKLIRKGINLLFGFKSF